jgi:hypothetical protein
MYLCICSSGNYVTSNYDGLATDSETAGCLLLTTDNDELVDIIRDIQTDKAFKMKPELKQLFQNQIRT